jgi:hypothetical protein
VAAALGVVGAALPSTAPAPHPPMPQLRVKTSATPTAAAAAPRKHPTTTSPNVLGLTSKGASSDWENALFVLVAESALGNTQDDTRPLVAGAASGVLWCSVALCASPYAPVYRTPVQFYPTSEWQGHSTIANTCWVSPNLMRLYNHCNHSLAKQVSSLQPTSRPLCLPNTFRSVAPFCSVGLAERQ